MDGHSISGTTDYNITRSIDRPKIPVTRFSQPVSVFAFTAIRVPVMSESSRVPNLFPVSAMWNNLLRLTYNR